MVNVISEFTKHTHPSQGGESGGVQLGRPAQARADTAGVLETWRTNWGSYCHEKSESHCLLGVGFVPRLGEGCIREKDSQDSAKAYYPVGLVAATVSNNSNGYSLMSAYCVLGTESSQNGYYAHFMDKENEAQ